MILPIDKDWVRLWAALLDTVPAKDHDFWIVTDKQGAPLYATDVEPEFNRGKQARFAPALPAALGLTGPRPCWR